MQKGARRDAFISKVVEQFEAIARRINEPLRAHVFAGLFAATRVFDIGHFHPWLEHSRGAQARHRTSRSRKKLSGPPPLRRLARLAPAAFRASAEFH
jgi:hypothetical protein